MATKPTKIPRWADVGGPIVEPNEAKKDVGWAPAERPYAQFVNWLANLNGEWVKYLNDGDLEGNHTIDGDLTVMGNFDSGFTPRQEVISAAAGLEYDIAGALNWDTGRVLTTSDDAGWTIGINLPEGTRLLTVQFMYERAGGGITSSVFATDFTTGVDSLIGQTAESGTSGFTTAAVAINTVLTIQTGFRARWVTSGAGATGSQFYGIRIIYDRPSP